MSVRAVPSSISTTTAPIPIGRSCCPWVARQRRRLAGLARSRSLFQSRHLHSSRWRRRAQMPCAVGAFRVGLLITTCAAQPGSVTPITGERRRARAGRPADQDHAWSEPVAVTAPCRADLDDLHEPHVGSLSPGTRIGPRRSAGGPWRPPDTGCHAPVHGILRCRSRPADPIQWAG